MSIYKISCDLSFRTLCWHDECEATDHLEYEFIRQFWNAKPIEKWTQPPIRFRTLAEESELEDDELIARQRFANGTGDCPWYSAAVLFFSERARDSLSDLLDGHGQFLPVNVEPEGTLFAFNCTTNLDALDRMTSDIEYYEHGPPRCVRRYTFREDVVAECSAFRLVWPRTYEVFVSDAVVKQISKCNLKGILATKTWEYPDTTTPISGT